MKSLDQDFKIQVLYVYIHNCLCELEFLLFLQDSFNNNIYTKIFKK